MGEWYQRLSPRARTDSGADLRQVSGNAAASLKASAVINLRLSTPAGKSFRE